MTTVSPLIVLERAVEVHNRLTAAGVPHALGGALALAYHVTQARATNDIDLNVTADPLRPEGVLGLRGRLGSAVGSAPRLARLRGRQFRQTRYP